MRLTAAWLYGWVLIVLMAAGMAITLRNAARFRHRTETAPVAWVRSAAIGAIRGGAYTVGRVTLSLA